MRRLVTLTALGLALGASGAPVLRADSAAITTLASSTYYGSTGLDEANDVAIGPDGSVYVAGRSDVVGTGSDAFVVKLAPDGSHVVYSTVVGGSEFDTAMALTVDAAGNVYVVGHTNSTNLPIVGGFQKLLAGDTDVWIAKLDASGNVVYSTYYGGASFENGMAIALGPTGAVYVSGSTGSLDLPGVNGFQMAYGGGFGEGFVLKMYADVRGPVFATYLGGGDDESVSDIAVDGLDRAHVVGATGSLDFPLAAALQSTFGGGFKDGFVTAFSPDGAALVFSSYIGGFDSDQVLSTAIDGAGAVYLTGSTSSFDYPTLFAYQSFLGGGAGDAFLTKLAPGGTSIVYSTYFGGNGSDVATEVAIDAEGNVHITGETDSTSLPLVAPIQPFVNGIDAFYARFSPDGATLLRATPLGGSGLDSSSAMAIGLGDAWLVGRTDSGDFPLVNPVQPALDGSADAFIARLTFEDEPPSNQPPVAVAGNDQTVSSTGCAVTVVLDGSQSSDPDGDPLQLTWSGAAGTAEGPSVTFSLLPGTYSFTLTVDDGRGGTATDTVSLTVVDNAPPVIGTLTASPSVLAPPNHQMIDVAVSVSLASACEGGTTCRIVSISSNEPINGLGDGDTAPDWVITGALTAQFRAERGQHPDGRVYTITVECVDKAGNASSKTVKVHVPR